MATTDVAMKCIAANDIKNGSVVVGKTRKDPYDSIEPQINWAQTVEAMEARWTERYDTVEELM